MDPAQRRRTDRAAQRRLTADDRGEHALHIGGRQLRQRDTAQIRDQVTTDMRGIPAAGRGPQRTPATPATAPATPPSPALAPGPELSPAAPPAPRPPQTCSQTRHGAPAAGPLPTTATLCS